jgi:hypothetical protein
LKKPDAGRTLITQWHGWRGFAREGGPLGVATTVGFFTVCWCPFLVTEWIKSRANAIKNAIGSD